MERIAKTYMRNPAVVYIGDQGSSKENITQQVLVLLTTYYSLLTTYYLLLTTYYLLLATHYSLTLLSGLRAQGEQEEGQAHRDARQR